MCTLSRQRRLLLHVDPLLKAQVSQRQLQQLKCTPSPTSYSVLLVILGTFPVFWRLFSLVSGCATPVEPNPPAPRSVFSRLSTLRTGGVCLFRQPAWRHHKRTAPWLSTLKAQTLSVRSLGLELARRQLDHPRAILIDDLDHPFGHADAEAAFHLVGAEHHQLQPLLEGHVRLPVRIEQ